MIVPLDKQITVADKLSNLDNDTNGAFPPDQITHFHLLPPPLNKHTN
jgi:hypothetical protein